MKNKIFNTQLKKGMAFESKLQQLLIQQNPDFYILPTHDFKTGTYAGPRMVNKTDPDIIVPDFMMVEKFHKHILLIEAKRKKKPFALGPDGDKFVGIEKYKVQDYRHVCNLFNAKLAFCVGMEDTRKVHFIKDQHFRIHNFNNQYSKVDTCCLPIEDNTIIGTF